MWCAMSTIRSPPSGGSESDGDTRTRGPSSAQTTTFVPASCSGQAAWQKDGK
jgi:hypothetical protein